MTIFVYLSRRPKVYGRPKKQFPGTPAKPSNLSWKPAQSVARSRVRPRARPLWKLHWIRRRIGLRYQPNPPQPASFLPIKRAFRIKIKRGRRFVKTPKLYSIAGPPAGLVPTRRMWRVRIRRGRRFIRLPRLYSIAGAPASFLPTKRAFRIRIKRARRFIRLPRLYSIAGPPASFVPFKKPPRAKIKRMRLRLRPRLFPILPAAALLFRKLPRLRIRRARRFIRFPRLYSIAGPPARFIPQKRMLRPKIKRVRLRLRPRLYPIVPALLVLFLRARRLRLKRRPFWSKFKRYPFQFEQVGYSAPRGYYSPRKSLLRAVRGRALRYPIGGVPVSFIAFKKPPRAKIKRMRLRPRPRLFPILPSLLVLYRKLPRLRIRRGRRFARFSRYSIAGATTSFVAFKKPPRAKIKKGKWSFRRFILGRYSIAGAPASVIPHKRFPRAKIKRGKWNLRRFAQRFYEFPGAPIISKAVEWLIRARRRGIR